MRKTKLTLLLPLAVGLSLPAWAQDKPSAATGAGAEQRKADAQGKKKHEPTTAGDQAVQDQKSPEGTKTHPPTGAMDKAMPTQKTPEKK
jgi:hypothetical protein